MNLTFSVLFQCERRGGKATVLFAALENFVTIKNHFTAATGSQNATGMHGNLNIMTVVRPAGRTCKVLIKCLCIANHKF